MDAALRLGLGFAPGSGLREAVESSGFTAGRLRDSGLFTERGAERFAGMVVVPEVAGGLVRWLAGRAVDPDAAPRFQALPGPKPVLGLGRLGFAPPWAVLAEGVFDWLAIAGWGIPACAALGTQGVEKAAASLRGCPRVFLAFDSDDAGREAAERLEGLLGRRAATVSSARGRRRRGRACGASPRSRRLPAPAGSGGTLREIAAASHSPHHFPLYRSLTRSGLACGTPSRSTPSPLSPPRRTYAQFTSGLACLPAPRTGFSLEARTGHSLQEVSTSEKETRNERNE